MLSGVREISRKYDPSHPHRSKPLLFQFLTHCSQGLLGKKYGLQWLAAMIQVISGEDLAPLVNKLIMPLYNLVELPENHMMKGTLIIPQYIAIYILISITDLKDTAQEILGMVQTKMGPTAYGQAYNTVRTEVQERRRARKYKRTIQVSQNLNIYQANPNTNHLY